MLQKPIEETVKIQESKKSFMEKLEDCTIYFAKKMYFVILWVLKILLMFLGFLFYPIKERFFNAAKNLDQAMNPYKNPNYHEI